MFDLADLFKEDEDIKEKVQDTIHNSKPKYPTNMEDLLRPLEKLSNNPSEEQNVITLRKFKEINFNKIKEDMLYYCASSQIFTKLNCNNKDFLINENVYEIHDDLPTNIFISSQNEKIKKVKGNKCQYFTIMKEKKLLNFTKTMNNNIQISKEKLASANLLIEKIGEAVILFFKEKNVEVLLEKFNELINCIKENQIEMKNVGYNLYISIENNLIFLLSFIVHLFQKDENELKKFIKGFINVLNYFKSNRVLFFFINFLSQYKKIADSNDIIKDNKINFNYEIPIDFPLLCSEKTNLKNSLQVCLEDFLVSKGYINPSKECPFDFDNYFIVNSKKNFIIFLKASIKDLNQKKIFCFKLDTENANISAFNDFYLTDDERYVFIDINISIKKGLVYLFYLVNDSKENKYYLECKILNYNTMVVLKENKIELQKDFIPVKIFNDDNYIYCPGKENNLLVIKKSFTLNKLNYSKYSISDIVKIENIKMHNNLNINQVIFFEEINNKYDGKTKNKYYYGEFQKYEKEYFLNVRELSTNEDENIFINKLNKISYNENTFFIVNINEQEMKISYDFSKYYNNSFIENGIRFLPFESCLNKNNSKNIYESLLKSYCEFINLYGNMDYINSNLEGVLLKFPLALCFNVNKNNLDIIIKKIVSEKETVETKYYYFIIAKQIICSLYNTNSLKIVQIKDLIDFMKNFVINLLQNGNDRYSNKILKEIIYISSYLDKNNIIVLDDVKNYLIDENSKATYKTKFLIIELLLTRKFNESELMELFEIIVNFEKKFLTEIFNINNSDNVDYEKKLSSNYNIFKSTMTKLSELFYVIYNNKLNDLLSFIPKISENIQKICDLYKKIIENPKKLYIEDFAYINNSFNFRIFYFIIQKIISSALIIENSYISIFYKVLLDLDKLNINLRLDETLDQNNVIQIVNSKLRNVNSDGENDTTNNTIIKFNEKQNIIFKNSLNDDPDLNKYYKIKLIKDKENKEKIEINLKKVCDYIYKEVYGLEIYIVNNNSSLIDCVLDVIPVKNEKEYTSLKHNENMLILSEIEKSLLYYFLFMFQEAKNQINEYLKLDMVKDFSKMYQTELLQFISVNKINLEKYMKKKDKKEDEKDNIDTSAKKVEENKDKKNKEDLINLSNNFIEKINNIMDDNDKNTKDKKSKNNISNILCAKFIEIFDSINKERNISNKNFSLDKYYKQTDATLLNKISLYKDINLENESYKKLFDVFENDLQKKNKILSAIKLNPGIKKIIYQIFSIILKYYNYNEKFLNLVEEIKQKNIENSQDYKLFYEIYENCCKMRIIFNEEKNRFSEENFDKEMENYIENNKKIFSFIYEIIIPGFSENYDKYLLSGLLKLVKNENFSVEKLMKYSEFQNLNCNIKIIELLIINNLLMSLNSEHNLKFILYLINNKLQTDNKNKINHISILDTIYGADYSQMEQVKNQFHLLINILIEKINKSDYSLTTKISLYQSLLWKIRARDFSILPKIISSFENLKFVQKKNSLKSFSLEHEKIYGINYYNEDCFNDIQFEIFKTLTYQIFSKINENLRNDNQIEKTKSENNPNEGTSLELKRNISKVVEGDFNNIISLIIPYFCSINSDNKYYHEFILFFYKNIINVPKLIESLILSHNEIITKILQILFSSDNDNNNTYNIYSKIIMAKLLLKFLENINDEQKLKSLIESIVMYDTNIKLTDNDNNSNCIFSYLFQKFNSILQKEENNLLKDYYIQLSLLCFSKTTDKNDKKDIILLLFSLNNHSIRSEMKFHIRNDYDQNKLKDKFEEVALFSSEDNKITKTGNILSFIDEQNAFNDYLDNDNNAIYFDKKDFIFNIEQNDKSKNAFVIMDDMLQEKISKIGSMEIKEISEICIVDDIQKFNTNDYFMDFFKKNSSFVYEIFLSELLSGKLSQKGINYIFRILNKLVSFINKDYAKKIMKFLFDYYIIFKEEEKNWDFFSLEYITNEINSQLDVFSNKSVNDIYIENNKNENTKKDNNSNDLILCDLFNYVIKNNNTLGFILKKNNKISKYYDDHLSLLNNNIKNTNELTMSNLSFYKAHYVVNETIIEENSLLLIEELSKENITELLNILKNNQNKIKAIIINLIKKEDKDDLLANYMDKFEIPLYQLKNHLFDKITKFFIEGEGGGYVPVQNQYNVESDIITIYRPLYLKSNNSSDKKIKIENTNIENLDDNKKNKNKDDFMYDDENEDNFFYEMFNDENDKNKKYSEEEKAEYLSKYRKNRQKKYAEINFDLNKVYLIENIKICKRILYEILSNTSLMKDFDSTDLISNIKEYINIFESLCEEYYFNINNKLSIKNIKNILQNYFQSITSNNAVNYKWLDTYFNNSVKSININNLELSEYVYNELFDKLLYLTKECNNLQLNENEIDIIYDIINSILVKIENDYINLTKEKENNNITSTLIIVNSNNNVTFKHNFIPYFLYEIMNGFYDSITNNKTNAELFQEYFLKSNIHSTMKKFVDDIIKIKDFFINNDNSKNNTIIPKSKTLIIQFAVRYFDLCFYLFFKETKHKEIIDYWLSKNNDFFKFYCNYKILSIPKHYDEIDYKETLALIAYISESIECYNKRLNDNENKINDNNYLKLQLNKFNKLDNLSINEEDTIVKFDLNSPKNDYENFKKLVIFNYDKSNNKYNLQDIIDTSSTSPRIYYQTLKDKETFLVPMKNVPVSLYAFGINFNHSLGINGKLAKFYDEPTKCVDFPKYSWNIGYGNNYCLALSEENNKIYACGCNKGGGFNSCPRAKFTCDTRANELCKEEKNNVSNENKIINFATGNCDSTLILDNKENIYGLGNNDKTIFGIENMNKLKYPLKLNIDKIKVNKIYIGFTNCYIIDNEGKLYGIGDNTYSQISHENKSLYKDWTNIALPEKCKKFIECAAGENYLITLIETDDGKNKIYARGNNNFCQCGNNLETEDKKVKNLTQCEKTADISFKKIYTRNNQSAAISVNGDLYTWGQNKFYNTGHISDIVESPTLLNIENIINKDEKINTNNNQIHTNYNNDCKVIVDDVAISNSHMLILGRVNENGIYTKKLYACGDNSKGALGHKISNNKELNHSSQIYEIKISEDNKKLIPMKLTIGDNKSYVLCIDENELIKEIEENSSIKKDCYVNISTMKVEKPGNVLLKFYQSENIDKFINLFKSVTNKILLDFIEVIDEIKSDETGKYKEASFHNFADYINNNKGARDLFMIFGTDDKNKQTTELHSIFNYLKTKTTLITHEIFKYCSTNEKCEQKQFLQKAIGNNISYLSKEIRLKKFNELMSKRTYRRGTERRVEVDRFKANNFYDKFNEDNNQIPDLEYKNTIFGQVFQIFGKTNGEEFFIQKGRRLFIVCLKNEYASDSGGPYHEVISGICKELQSDYLNMFIKTPNNKYEIGLLQDKYIPNPQATREIDEKCFIFLGKLMASAIASGEVLDLNLHPVVWKAILGNEITFYDYENIDYTFFNLISQLEISLKNQDTDFDKKYTLNFVIKNSDEINIELKPNGKNIEVTMDNLKEYIFLSKKYRVNEFMAQIENIKKGFNSVIPSSIFQVLNWRQLEEMVCGKTKLDIRDLKKNTRYDGYNENDKVVKWFWEWLEESNEHEQAMYLKFVSGRTRLPKADKNFVYEHIIFKSNSKDAFPHSATCFFTLKLPNYSSKEVLKEKMRYSIMNCAEIDADH